MQETPEKGDLVEHKSHFVGRITSIIEVIGSITRAAVTSESSQVTRTYPLDTLRVLEKAEASTSDFSDVLIDFEEYQEAVKAFVVYPPHSAIAYTLLGLGGGLGELMQMHKRSLRDGTVPAQEDICLEAGDLLWYLTRYITEQGLSLEEVARKNLEKLQGRAANNTLHGKGDHR